MSEIPPPPPLPSSQAVRPTISKASQGAPSPPFSTTGTTKEDKIFEFFNPNDCAGAISLKAIVRHYLAVPRLHNVPASELYMILGRLRCLNHAVGKYNEGVTAPSPAFLQYWKQRALNQLSGFGFQISHAEESIRIPGLKELIHTLEDIFHSDIFEARDIIRRGLITFDALGELYRHDTPVQGMMTLGGTAAVFFVVDSYYQQNRGLTGVQRSFHWSMEFVATMGSHFTVVSLTEVLNGWTGVRARALSELTYVPVDPCDLRDLQKRGERYVQFAAGGAKFLGYTCDSFFRHSRPSRQGYASLSSSSCSQLPSSGRVMIDADRGALLGHHASQGLDEPTLAMTKLAERYRQWRNTTSTKSSSTDALLLWETVPPEFNMYCWPALVGFSFTAKTWGHVLVAGLEPIEFHDEAFQRLVLAEDRKQLIRALVRFGNNSDTDDIVGGKRSGSIFLLHGPPGVGKTLTAEAVAEVLHRPLYYVTMGELGTTAEDMERRLTDVLDLCAEWNAIIVLDEADVFLEQRRTSDLVRNSMVCVMLRLLEYHSGILFLTTNRVRNFDPAFESRVTIALRYESLVPEARSQIWENLLERISVPVSPNVAPRELGNHELNGRQIKSAVRLACAVARERQVPELTQEILEEILQLTSIGKQEMANDDSWRV